MIDLSSRKTSPKELSERMQRSDGLWLIWTLQRKREVFNQYFQAVLLFTTASLECVDDRTAMCFWRLAASWIKADVTSRLASNGTRFVKHSSDVTSRQTRFVKHQSVTMTSVEREHTLENTTSMIPENHSP